MSLNSEIQRTNSVLTALQTALASIKSKITSKGGTIGASDGFSDVADAIDTIPSGGGGDSLFGKPAISGTTTIVSDTTSTFTLLSSNDLVNAFKDEFPGLENSYNDYYYLKDSAESSRACEFMFAYIFLYDPYSKTYSYNNTQLVNASSISGFMGSKSFVSSTSVSTVSNIVHASYSALFVSGSLFLNLSKSYKLLAGTTYKWFVGVNEHGEKVAT